MLEVLSVRGVAGVGGGLAGLTLLSYLVWVYQDNTRTFIGVIQDLDGTPGTEPRPPRPLVATPCSATWRATLLARECRRRGYSGHGAPVNTPHLLVDDLHKVIYCSIPKVACSTFKAVMASSAAKRPLEAVLNRSSADGKLPMVHGGRFLARRGVHRLARYSAPQRRHRLASYFKFLVVRHPFDRLLSAYRDKVEHARRANTTFPFFLQNRNKILKHFGGRSEDLYKGDLFMANFSDFLSLVAAGSTSWFRNPHWGSFRSACRPCAVAYDSVVRLETLSGDLEGILTRLPDASGRPFHLPAINVRSHVTRDRMRDLRDHYRGVSRDVIEGLLRVYRKDFELFGYHWDSATAEGGCSMETGGQSHSQGQSCC